MQADSHWAYSIKKALDNVCIDKIKKHVGLKNLQMFLKIPSSR